MNILLIGEFSRLHNSLKEGLTELGHKVTIVGTGDDFKNYPIDIQVKNIVLKQPVLLFIAKVIHKLSGISLVELENAYRYYKLLPQLKSYDIVQLINENSLKTHPKLEIWLLKRLFKQNKKVFLLSCGADHVSVKYAYSKKLKYSILTPIEHSKKPPKNYKYILRYLKPSYKKLHDFLYQNINGVIASDLDYHMPLLNNPKYLGLIPNPINLNKIAFIENRPKSKIKIFHGINVSNYTKKGTRFFEEALSIIQKKYPDAVEIVTTKDVPYNQYINLYNNCHILLDQVYSYDQGFNALEAMAKGKVVFTGAEQEWLDYYNIEKDTVAINAVPDHKAIAHKLEWLILNPGEIQKISKNARQFIEQHHNYLLNSQRYLDAWLSR